MSEYLPGYFLTPEIIDQLNEKPDLCFVFKGAEHKVLIKKNDGLKAPLFSVYVQTERILDGKVIVNNKICGANSALAALKGIDLVFGEEALRILKTRKEEIWK